MRFLKIINFIGRTIAWERMVLGIYWGDKHLKNCSVIGGDWDTLFKYLGKPNIIIMGKSDTFYRYRLNNFTEDLGAPGNLFLEISVQGGKVTTFAVVMVDG